MRLQPTFSHLCAGAKFLFHLDVLQHLGLLLGSGLRDDDGEDAVGYARGDLLAVYVVGQRVALLVVAVGELAAQIVLVARLMVLLALLLVLHLVLDGHVEQFVVGDVHAHPLLLQPWNGHLHDVLVYGLLDVDCRSRVPWSARP